MKPKPLCSTPTSAMIEALSTMGMTMKEAAGFVLADNGSIPRAYADDLSHRSTLTKRFKQAHPGSLTSNDFDDFTVSVPRLLRELLSQRHVALPEGGARSAQVAGGLLDQLIGEPAQAMERALQNYSLAPDVFASALDDALAAPLPSTRAHLELAFILYVATGCLSDPVQAAAAMEAYARKAYGTSVLTNRPEHDGASVPDNANDLCLLRITGMGSIGYRHMPSPTELGTMIGLRPKFAGPTITDVDPSVSPNHLRIFRRDGRWWAQGAGSERGTILARGSSGQHIAIELPASERTGEPIRPVELEPTDTLVLGSTVFRILQFRAS